MKKVLSVLAVAALVLVSFSGCNGDKTYTDILTQSKGWVLSSATSTPAYRMMDGSFVEDLMHDGYLKNFENEYVITFNADGSEYVKPGKTVAPEDYEGDAYRAETKIGTWRFDNELIPLLLYMQVPFFYDEDVEVCQISSLTEKELKIRCTIQDYNPEAKYDNDCTFTLTFVPAK